MRLVVFLLCLIAAGTAQEFKVGTTQVRVDILATNDKGILDGLEAKDFVVTDEGSVVKLKYFGRDDAALNVLLLLDVSGSMKNFLDQIGKRAQAILGQLRETDRVGVMGFSKETDFLMPFTGNMDRAANAVNQAMRPGFLPAGTAINVALVDAAQAFLDNPKLTGHRTVFILTDNKALNYKVSDETVLRQLFAADAVLNSIVTRNAEAPKPLKNSEQRNPDFSFADVFKLSLETGGEVLRTDRADEALAKLLANLRGRYLATYDAPEAGPNQFRRIQVSLTKEAQKRYGKVTIRVRAGYYTGS